MPAELLEANIIGGRRPYTAVCSVRFIIVSVMENLKALIAVIKTGTRPEVKAAQKRVEKLWHRSCFEPELRKEFAAFALEARSYDEITDFVHKLAFLNTLKWPLWADESVNYDFWAEFLLARVQDPEGKIRLAAVRAAEYLAVDMLGSFDTPAGRKFKELSIEARARIRSQFFSFALKADELVRRYRTPQMKKYRYISSLPPGIYKSCQQLLNQSLLTTPELKEQLLAFMLEQQPTFQLPPHNPGHA